MPTNSRVMPFAQAGLGAVSNDGNGQFALLFAGGVNYMLTRSVAIGAQLRYQMSTGSGFTAHAFTIPVAFALYFGI
ncbi:MAG: hypothetical protein R3A11_02210 [Bdellovibrionota bacterium]